MDIKKRITFTQLLSHCSGPDLSEEGIEVVVCYLEDEEGANHQINAAKALKEKEKIVLSIGWLTSPFENKKAIRSSLGRAMLLQRASDGCILLNKDSFIDRGCKPEEVGTQIELMTSDIEQGLQDILRDGPINIEAETLREVLRDCGTFMVTYGDGTGADRVELAFHNAYESIMYKGLDLKTAQTLIIKVLVSKEDTLSTAEQTELKQLISELPEGMNIIFGLGTSDLEAGQIQIVILGTGVLSVLG